MGPELLLDVSFPFCPRRCDYCDRPHLSGGTARAGAYMRAVCLELEAVAPDFSDHALAAVRLGRGMPAMMGGAGLRRLERTALGTLPRGDAPVELLVEATPDYLSADFLTGVRGEFALRPAFGMASMIDQELAWLGAVFNRGAMLDCLELLGCRGIRDFQIDLLYGIFGQTPNTLRHSIDDAARLGARRIGLSRFRLAAGSGCERLMREGRLPALDDSDDRLRELYEAGAARLGELGFGRTADDEFALPGFEGVFRAGLRDGADVVGLGLGAESSFEGVAATNTEDLEAYLAAPQDPSVTYARCEVLDG